MSETPTETIQHALVERVRGVLLRVEYPGYTFAVTEGHGGVHMRASYDEADAYEGGIEVQMTRKWLVSPAMTDSEIVQTALKLILTSHEHRAREAFHYRGERVYAPHYNVEDLVALCKDGRERAGGRLSPPQREEERRG